MRNPSLRSGHSGHWLAEKIKALSNPAVALDGGFTRELEEKRVFLLSLQSHGVSLILEIWSWQRWNLLEHSINKKEEKR